MTDQTHPHGLPDPVVDEALARGGLLTRRRHLVVCVGASVTVLAVGIGGLMGYQWFVGGDAPVMAGVVVDEDGAPVDGLPVTVYLVDVDELGHEARGGADEDEPGTDEPRFRIGGATTGSDGSFAVRGGIPRYAPVGDHRGTVDLVVTLGSEMRTVELEALPSWDTDGPWRWPDDPALVVLDDVPLAPSRAGRPLTGLRLTADGTG